MAAIAQDVKSSPDGMLKPSLRPADRAIIRTKMTTRKKPAA